MIDFKLTEREREALAGLDAGKQPIEMAKEMGIAPQTFANHVRNIAEKVSVAISEFEARGGDDSDDGGAGVREPRHPTPIAPSGQKAVDE